jgi:RHS repeat-associated protein
VLLVWDPFGQPVDPVTLAIGTAASDDKGQVAGNTAWHQGALKPAESAGSTLVVEMGARLYVPALGRFLQVDPIEGGGANDYVWPPDPINGHDLSGNIAIAIPLFAILVALLLIAAYISMPRPVLPPIAINFRWPTIKAPTDKKATSTAIPQSIPRPTPTNYRANEKYKVYEIFQTGTRETWKYGITSGSPLEARPQTQLAACARDFGACSWNWKTPSPVTGYYTARVIEYGYIVDYYLVHGQCPPGQVVSCK